MQNGMAAGRLDSGLCLKVSGALPRPAALAQPPPSSSPQVLPGED